MTEMLLGALGALIVLALLAAGFCLGWKARGWAKLRQGKAAEKEAAMEERRSVMEEQRAFRELMNYNTEIAYGMNGQRPEEVDSQ